MGVWFFSLLPLLCVGSGPPTSTGPEPIHERQRPYHRAVCRKSNRGNGALLRPPRKAALFASGFMESRLALLSPRLVSFRYLPGPQAGILCHDQLIGQHPGIVLKRLVEQPLGLSCGGWGTSTNLLDDLAQQFLALRRRAGIVDQSRRARFSGCNPFVQQRKLLGAAQADDPRQPQYCSIRNQAVSRRPQLDY